MMYLMMKIRCVFHWVHSNREEKDPPRHYVLTLLISIIFQKSAFDKSQTNSFRENWIIQSTLTKAISRHVTTNPKAMSSDLRSKETSINFKYFKDEEFDTTFQEILLEDLNIKCWNDIMHIEGLNNDVISILK